MEKIYSWLAFGILIAMGSASFDAFARAGGASGAATAVAMAGPGPTGLCTGDIENMAQKWISLGWCRSIKEAMTAKECARLNMDSLRQKALAGKIKDLELFCPNMNKIATDQAKFNSVMQQIVAALAVEESHWGQSAVGPAFSVAGSKQSRSPVKSRARAVIKSPVKKRAKGLLQLSLESAKQKQYECGCENIKTEKDVMDAEKNLQCGTWIAMYWMNEHNALGEGTGNDVATGLGKYFQPYRDIDGNKRERMQGKVAGYCVSRGATDNGLEEDDNGLNTRRFAPTRK